MYLEREINGSKFCRQSGRKISLVCLTLTVTELNFNSKRLESFSANLTKKAYTLEQKLMYHRCANIYVMSL